MDGPTMAETATIKVEEAARILGIGRQLAYDLARQKRLPGALHLGRRIVVSRIALQAFLDGANTGVGDGDEHDRGR